MTSAAFSPDGKQIVFGLYDNSVRVWDAVTGTVPSTLQDHLDTGPIFKSTINVDLLSSAKADF